MKTAYTPIRPENALGRQDASKARSAHARAVVVIRMLLGSPHWCDGYERSLDDCFEMGDGDEVVRELIHLADSDSEIATLLSTHRNIGANCVADWRKRYPEPQLTLF